MSQQEVHGINRRNWNRKGPSYRNQCEVKGDIRKKQEDRRRPTAQRDQIKVIKNAPNVVENTPRQISALHKGNSVINVISIIILHINAFLKRLIGCMKSNVSMKMN